MATGWKARKGCKGNMTRLRVIFTPSADPMPLVFGLQPGAIRDGRLSLRWNVDAGGMGPGRGCPVAEVWPIRKSRRE